MKKLILDYSTWRSGGDQFINNVPNENIVGKGVTKLKNQQGFRCCLGQFIPQIDESFIDTEFEGLDSPSQVSNIVGKEIKGLSCANTKPEFSSVWHQKYLNTQLTTRAIEINDDYQLNTIWRIDKLKKLFAEYGYEIEVINLPQ